MTAHDCGTEFHVHAGSEKTNLQGMFCFGLLTSDKIISTPNHPIPSRQQLLAHFFYYNSRRLPMMLAVVWDVADGARMAQTCGSFLRPDRYRLSHTIV